MSQRRLRLSGSKTVDVNIPFCYNNKGGKIGCHAHACVGMFTLYREKWVAATEPIGEVDGNLKPET